MAVDLGDLIEFVQAAVNAPGENFFPAAEDDDWINQLRNAFWVARLHGWFTAHREADGLVANITTGGADLDRWEQQMIVEFAAYNTVRNKLMALATRRRSKAGPVESDIERSAQVLQLILKDIRARIDELKLELIKAPNRPSPAFLDAVFERDEALYYGDLYSWK